MPDWAKGRLSPLASPEVSVENSLDFDLDEVVGEFGDVPEHARPKSTFVAPVRRKVGDAVGVEGNGVRSRVLTQLNEIYHNLIPESLLFKEQGTDSRQELKRIFITPLSTRDWSNIRIRMSFWTWLCDECRKFNVFELTSAQLVVLWDLKQASGSRMRGKTFVESMGWLIRWFGIKLQLTAVVDESIRASKIDFARCPGAAKAPEAVDLVHLEHVATTKGPPGHAAFSAAACLQALYVGLRIMDLSRSKLVSIDFTNGVIHGEMSTDKGQRGDKSGKVERRVAWACPLVCVKCNNWWKWLKDRVGLESIVLGGQSKSVRYS